MALILNKSVTGITSSEIIETGVIESGVTESGTTHITYTETGYVEVVYNESDYVMTEYTTGYTNLNYKDEFGNTHENPYLVVDAVIINKLDRFAKVYISIYKDEESRTNKMKSLFETHFGIDDKSIYDTYFNIEDMKDVNIFEKAYIFINELYYQDWLSDE